MPSSSPCLEWRARKWWACSSAPPARAYAFFLGDRLDLCPVCALEGFQGTQILPLKFPRPCDLGSSLLGLLCRRRLCSTRRRDLALAFRPVPGDLGLGHVLVVLADHAEDRCCHVLAARDWA